MSTVCCSCAMLVLSKTLYIMSSSRAEGEAIRKPIHVGTLVAMGVHLIDNCWLDDLAAACASLGRWEFLLTVAPLRLENGTDSPVNPIAVL